MSSAGSYGAVFVGRARELRELGAALDAAFAGRGALLLLRGEPGAGKTSLARQFAVAAAARGALVAWGHSAEGDAPPAFWAWAQCFRAIAGRRSLEEMLADFEAGERDLLTSLVDLRPPQDARPHARFLLFEAVARLLRQEGLGRPLVLILDDLQDADASSLLLLRFLVDRLGNDRTLVLGLLREGEVGLPPATSGVLRELSARASILPVRGFSDGDIHALYRARSGRVAGDVLIRNLAWASGGNALFVDEMVRAIAFEGESYPVRVPGRLPATDRARHAIRRRLESLPEDATDVLRTASVLGDRFDIALLARLLGRSPETTAAAVERLEAVHLLEPIPAERGARRFTHALFRDVIYADLPASRRADLHRRAAEVLEAEATAGGASPAVTDLAHHWWEARPAGADPARARAWAVRAADDATERLAYEEAAELYRRAVESSPPEDPRTADLLLSLGRALWSAGELGEARDAFERAAGVARLLRDACRLAEAALGCGAGVGAPYVSYGPDPVLVDLLEEALAMLPPAEDRLRASCLARLAVALHHGRDRENRRVTLADEAIAIAARLGDPALRLTTLYSRQWALFGLDTLPERAAIADEILRLAGDTGNPDLYWAHYFRLTVALDTGDFPAIAREIDHCGTLARAVPLPLVQWRTATLRAMRAILEGSLVEGEAETARARDLGERTRIDLVPAAFAGQMHVIRWLQGRLREIESEVRAYADRFPWSSRWRAGLAWLYAETGRAADAQAELQRVATPGLVEGPRDGSWGVRLYALAMTAASLGDRAVAAELYEALRPFADRYFNNGTVLVSWGSASVPLGILAATLGRLDEADTHLRAAVAANTRLGNRPFMALALREHAAVLLARGGAGDRTEAARLLDDAALLMREHGFDGLVARTAALRAEAQAKSSRTARNGVENVIRREGQYWTVGFDGRSVRLRDTKGLRYLATLMLRPGIEVHALELAAENDAPANR
ncbi:MAG: ATP-binding protein, partial [Candidatus Binatia bacterium]